MLKKLYNYIHDLTIIVIFIMDIYDLIKRLFPIDKSISGDGIRETLHIISDIIPIDIKNIKSGTEVYDWTVPNEWNIRGGFIKNIIGETIVDYKNHNLHIMKNSLNISQYISKLELLSHIHTLPEQPKLIPYKTSYYKEDWGFCMTHEDYKKKIINCKADKFYVEIDSDFKNGEDGGVLNYGELLIKGKSDKEILLSSYICHPSMVNDSLSGVAILVYLALWLLDKKNKDNLYYSYRIVFIPETIGSITYIHENYDILKKRVIGGYVLTCLGDCGIFTYLMTPNGNNIVDKVTKYILCNYKYREYRLKEFYNCGSDERQYNSPLIDLNIGSLMRTMYGEYPTYHTSGDDLSITNVDNLKVSFDMYKLCLDLFDNYNKFMTNIYCEPFMSKYNLYPTVSVSGASAKRDRFDTKLLMLVLRYSNGKNDIFDIYYKLSNDDLHEIMYEYGPNNIVSICNSSGVMHEYEFRDDNKVFIGINKLLDKINILCANGLIHKLL